MSDLKRLRPGDYTDGIPGYTWNKLVAGEERDRAKSPPGIRGPEGTDFGEAPSPARVLVKNDSGSDAPTGGVLKLTGIVHEPAVEPGCEYNGPVFTGGMPSANEQHVAILTEPIADGFLGWGVIPNAAWAQVNVSNSGHTYAKPKASVAELESDASTGFPIIWKESGTGAGKWAVVSLIAPGDTGNIIYAQVVGNVTSSDPTFTFDNAVALVGSIPAGGTGTAQNQYAQEYLDNEFVILSQRKDNSQWLTERGGTSGSQVVYCEATENKGYADPACLAKPVLEDGTLDSGADAFYIVDDTNGFYIRAAEDGQDGYRFHAVRFTDDYSEGIPGFRIIAGEGPAQFLVVMLDENLASPTDCSFAEDPAVFGLAFRGRTPAPVGAVDVQVYDDRGVATGAESGEKWEVIWNEDDERYCFWRKLIPKKYYIRVRGETTATVSASTTSFDIDTVELIQGDMPELTGGELTIQNVAKIPLANGATAEFRWNEDEQQWETEPLTSHEVLGLATAAVSGGSFSIDNIELICGSDPRTDPSSSSETLSVSNPFGWDIDDNGQVMAVKKANGTWIATQAECPA